MNKKTIGRYQRHKRIRAKIIGTKLRPRLSVFRSLNNIYAQLIDDAKGETMFSASDYKMKEKANKTERALKVGEELGKKAVEKGIKEVVFDRGGYKYFGRVRSLAEGAKKAGLKF